MQKCAEYNRFSAQGVLNQVAKLLLLTGLMQKNSLVQRGRPQVPDHSLNQLVETSVSG